MSKALRRRRVLDALALALLVTLALAFSLHVSSPQLASDDIKWLEGRPSTDLDAYRVVPRLAFSALHGIWGPNASAARVMIALTHALNGLMIYSLGRVVLGRPLAAVVSSAAFLINPLTVGTLTWISCYSYVLGACFALLALLSFSQALQCQADRPAWPWLVLALCAYAAGLLSSHEILFLPVLFLVMGWLRGSVRRGMTLCLAGCGLALLASVLVYQFGRQGLTARPLVSPGFLLAYTSSSLSSGLALALGYPLSFWVKPIDFLRICFEGPVRWSMTTLVLAAFLLLSRDRDVRRGFATLAVSYVVLVTPFLIRLYLTPEAASFDLAYLLAGRVLYVPFGAVALGLGALVSWLARVLGRSRWARLLLLFPMASYLYAFWLYDETDFLGLSLIQGLSSPLTERWTPFARQQALWALLPLSVVIALVGLPAVFSCLGLRATAVADGVTGWAARPRKHRGRDGVPPLDAVSNKREPS